MMWCVPSIFFGVYLHQPNNCYSYYLSFNFKTHYNRLKFDVYVANGVAIDVAKDLHVELIEKIEVQELLYDNVKAKISANRQSDLQVESGEEEP